MDSCSVFQLGASEEKKHMQKSDSSSFPANWVEMNPKWNQLCLNSLTKAKAFKQFKTAPT